MYQGKLTTAFQFKKPEKLDFKLPNPNGILILVRLLEVEEKTKGGLMLDNVTKADATEGHTIGYVESLGNLCYKHTKFEGQPYCKEGDYIMFSRFSGIKFELVGHNLMYLQDDKVITTFTEQQLKDLGILKEKD